MQKTAQSYFIERRLQLHRNTADQQESLTTLIIKAASFCLLGIFGFWTLDRTKTGQQETTPAVGIKGKFTVYRRFICI